MTAPMTPKLDEARLRELATEAKYCWPAGEWVKEHSLEQTHCLDPEDRAFIAAANPAAILALLDALSAERERGAWKDIDTAPKDGTSILLVDAEDHPTLFSIGFWNGRDGWDDGDFHDRMTGFTHWKPLTFEDADHG